MNLIPLALVSLEVPAKMKRKMDKHLFWSQNFYMVHIWSLVIVLLTTVMEHDVLHCGIRKNNDVFRVPCAQKIRRSVFFHMHQIYFHRLLFLEYAPKYIHYRARLLLLEGQI